MATSRASFEEAVTEAAERLNEFGNRLAQALISGMTIDQSEYEKSIVKANNAEKRAKELLTGLLDPEQLEMFETHQCFIVIGGETGDHYLISTTNNQGNVVCLNTGQGLCIVNAKPGIPDFDQFAAQLLMVQCEESAFLAQANTVGYANTMLYLKTRVGRELAEKIMDDVEQRTPQITRSNPFEAVMPGMFDELDSLMRGHTYVARTHCNCPTCTEGRQRYARERGRDMEEQRRRELWAIVGNPSAPMDARMTAERELNRGRDSPVNWWHDGGRIEVPDPNSFGAWAPFIGRRSDVTIEPISMYCNDPNGPELPPFDERWRYHIRGPLTPATEQACRVLRERGLATRHVLRGSEPSSFEMDVEFRDVQVINEIRYLFGV